MRPIVKYGLLLLSAIAAALLLVPGLASQNNKIWYSDRVAVIAYHHIDDQIQGDVTITTARFRDQLTDLLQRGYHFISLQQFRAYMAGGPVPPNAVLVTFDDGYRSFYTNAYPVLKELNIPATNFVITKDLANPLASRIPSLSREEIRQMTGETKGIDVQCHTDNLHDVGPDGGALFTTPQKIGGRMETEAEFERRIVEDTKMCRAKLAELYPGPEDAFAYPFGIYDQHSASLLQQAGIRYAFTTVSGLTSRSTDPMQIPRINAGSPFVQANSLNNLIIRKLHQSQSTK
ncbi:polysaccharide deacetylase family protein [Paenibacillus filicis]|uniref:Polysaccharide deacetylase family protein n=1 Tax=Paenibacillus gyeongsangnamensis TaxID=3388067 RepID=A0ABT4QKT0_9BACL|nr:polysaccharide deacetylase family protein [Paenibacillus filicis]MCZ8517454.1 polysaccharide deacetylase family protein [Paenibacillus filicis]